jgi:FixJ family two-component response regulator
MTQVAVMHDSLARVGMECRVPDIPASVVYIVDDDASMREALQSLIRAGGYQVRAFESAQQFLRFERCDLPACLVLDVRMPDTSGLDLQRTLAEDDADIPVIFITAHADIATSVRAMKAGALEFFTKPFSDRDLLDAIARALEVDAARRKSRAEMTSLKRRRDTLSAREQQVMAGVVQGLLNKQVADLLGVTEITIKVHRRHIMQKMKARSFADLVRMAGKLG